MHSAIDSSYCCIPPELMYRRFLLRAEKAIGYDDQVAKHKVYAMRAYMLNFFGTTILVDKSATYVDVICGTLKTLSDSMSTIGGSLVW